MGQLHSICVRKSKGKGWVGCLCVVHWDLHVAQCPLQLVHGDGLVVVTSEAWDIIN